MPRAAVRLIAEERPDDDARWAAAIAILLAATRRYDQGRERDGTEREEPPV